MADLVDLEARLDRLASIDEIRQLASRYALALDQRDLDALVGLFVDDVRVDADTRGREALRAGLEGEHLRRLGITVLHVGNHVVELDGPDAAHGSVYCRAELQTDDETWVSQAVHYGDRYERRDGRWYFRSRRHELLYGVAFGQRPNGQPPADWPANDVGTGTLPQRWDTWQSFWSR
jgi:ketosteroid isomerase-like protein